MGLDDFRTVKTEETHTNHPDVEKHNVNSDKMKGLFIGLVIGEGSFHVSISSKEDCVTGFTVRPKFAIQLHKADKYILKYLHDEIGMGYYKDGKDYFVEYEISTHNECKKLIKWLEENAQDTVFSETDKYDSFIKWKECVAMIVRGEHNTQEGLIEIAEMREDINRDNRHRSVEDIKEELEN